MDRSSQMVIVYIFWAIIIACYLYRNWKNHKANKALKERVKKGPNADIFEDLRKRLRLNPNDIVVQLALYELISNEANLLEEPYKKIVKKGLINREKPKKGRLYAIKLAE